MVLVDGSPVVIGARAFDVLLALFERRDRTVTKSEMLDLVWPAVFVEENNLQVQVSALRKLLGPSVIATIPGRGYRFTATLDDAGGDGGARTDPVVSAARDIAGSVSRPRNNLPRVLPPLYGRELELEEVCRRVLTQRMVTMVGAGGIGKSRLAQATVHALASKWPDGAWMVELAGLSEPGLLPNAVAQVLQIDVGSGPIDALVAGMADRSMLVVLDNCEHMLEPVATLVEAILQSTPGIAVLCTSQLPLHLAAEQQYRVQPLAIPSEATINAAGCGAIALFDARVRAVDPRFALNAANMALAIEICHRLDGLPLAIELAAARVAKLGLRTVRDKLDARFRLLIAERSPTALPRHQTLHAALAWSHNLLDEAERLVFRRLGSFAGGFTMELAQAVTADAQLDEWAVLDRLSALVDKSLVVADGGDVPRYRLLESARAYALEKLSSSESVEISRRHAVSMLEFLARVDGANLDGDLRTDEYAAQVLPELDNLRAAHRWATAREGDMRVAIALAAHAGSLVDYAVECVDWLLPLQEQVARGVFDDAVTARFWRAIAASNMAGRVPRGTQSDAADRAQSMYRRLEQPRRLYSSLIHRARHLRAQKDGRAARQCLDEARALIQPDWPATLRILQFSADGSIARGEGRDADAVAEFRQAVRLCVSARDWRLEVIQRNNLLDALWSAGPLDAAAREACQLAADVRARPAGDSDTAVILANLIGILCEMGQIDQARMVACEALPYMRRSQRCYLEVWVYLFWKLAKVECAIQLLGASDAEVLEMGEPLQPNEARLISEARAALAAGQTSEMFSRTLAVGAASRVHEIFGLISECLDEPPGTLA